MCGRVGRTRFSVHAWAYALHALARRRGVLNSCGAYAQLQVGARWLHQELSEHFTYEAAYRLPQTTIYGVARTPHSGGRNSILR